MSRHRYTDEQQDVYRRYLNSPQWRAKKTDRIRKAGGCCEFTFTEYLPGQAVEKRCTRTRYLCVHHETYERLGAERDNDLAVLCWAHHMLEHLLWARCQCSQPRLGNDVEAEKWLIITLSTMGINLDEGPVNWTGLPTKEKLLEQVPLRCPGCEHITRKD